MDDHSATHDGNRPSSARKSPFSRAIILRSDDEDVERSFVGMDKDRSSIAIVNAIVGWEAT
jgi:hypothetical protein